MTEHSNEELEALRMFRAMVSQLILWHLPGPLEPREKLTSDIMLHVPTLISQSKDTLLRDILEALPKTEDIPLEFRGPSEQAEIAPKMLRNVTIGEITTIIKSKMSEKG